MDEETAALIVRRDQLIDANAVLLAQNKALQSRVVELQETLAVERKRKRPWNI